MWLGKIFGGNWKKQPSDLHKNLSKEAIELLGFRCPTIRTENTLSPILLCYQ
jgi:hypothetical protein